MKYLLKPSATNAKLLQGGGKEMYIHTNIGKIQKLRDKKGSFISLHLNLKIMIFDSTESFSSRQEYRDSDKCWSLFQDFKTLFEISNTYCRTVKEKSQVSEVQQIPIKFQFNLNNLLTKERKRN